MQVKLYSFERKIGDKTYSFNVPCTSWEDAEALASRLDVKVTGTDIEEVPAIPLSALMAMVESQCTAPVCWKANASDQLEAFLCKGWPADAMAFMDAPLSAKIG